MCLKSAGVGLGVTRAEVGLRRVELGVVRLTILKAAALTPHPCHAARAEVFHHNFNPAPSHLQFVGAPISQKYMLKKKHACYLLAVQMLVFRKDFLMYDAILKRLGEPSLLLPKGENLTFVGTAFAVLSVKVAGRSSQVP